MHATWLWRILKRRSILCNLLALLMNFTTTKHEKKNICDHDIIHYIAFRSIILRWCRGFLSSSLALSHSLLRSFFLFSVRLYGWLLHIYQYIIPRMQPTCWLLGQTNRCFESNQLTSSTKEEKTTTTFKYYTKWRMTLNAMDSFIIFFGQNITI